MKLNGIRYAIEESTSFYSDGVVFEGSMALHFSHFLICVQVCCLLPSPHSSCLSAHSEHDGDGTGMPENTGRQQGLRVG